MLGGLAIAFTAAALIATATAHWLIVANVVGRDIALALFAIVGITLVSTRAAEWIARPATRAGAALLGAHTEASARPPRCATSSSAWRSDSCGHRARDRFSEF